MKGAANKKIGKKSTTVEKKKKKKSSKSDEKKAGQSQVTALPSHTHSFNVRKVGKKTVRVCECGLKMTSQTID